MRLPHAAHHYVFGAPLSGMMSFIVSGISTLKALGPTEVALAQWPSAWLASWAIAFPAVLVVAPIVRRLTARIVAPPELAVASNPVLSNAKPGVNA